MTNFSPFVSGGYLVGTPLNSFDFAQAVRPGMSEATYVAQLNKAIAFWTNVLAMSTNPVHLAHATTSIPWLQTELGLVSNPPPNSLRTVYPV